MPLQDIFVENFKNEIESARKCDEIVKQLYEVKCVKRLEKCKNDQDARRKQLRSDWERKQKEFVSFFS